jgi:hypothetical protein
MPRLSFRGRSVDINVDVSRIARDHPQLDRVRNAMIAETGDVARVDQYLVHRLAAALGKFGLDYMGDMGGRIDRIFALRDDLANSLDAVLHGDSVHIDALKSKFAELDRELDLLSSPTKAVEQAKTLDVPRDPPPQTATTDTPPPPPAKGGGGGGPHPPDTLTQISRSKLVRAGLQVVESQTAAPELRSRIAAIAGASPRLAQDLLRGIGRFLTPDDTLELQAISHYLDQKGPPRPLARMLTLAFESQAWAPPIRAGLRMMRSFDAEAARGVGALFTFGPRAEVKAARIFFNCVGAEGLAPGIFASLARLEKVRGLRRVIDFLAGPPQSFKAAQGQLLSANQLKDLHPNGILVFEDLYITESGRMRFPDISVHATVLGLPLHVEVKFFTDLDSIQPGTRDQLARDLIIDVENRHAYPRLDGTLEPPLAATVWRFERGNVSKQLSQDLGRPATDADLKAEIKRRMEAVFTEHEPMLRQYLGAEFDAYKTAFERMDFVTLY